MELHTQTRTTKIPDPEYDCIQGIFYRIYKMSKENFSIIGKLIELHKIKIPINLYLYICMYN